MTDIDLKRLAVDREYWDEVCDNPNATHFCKRHEFFGADRKPCTDCIPRPTKQEWTPGRQAVKTLESMNYTYHGGEYWKPPLGKVPAHLQEWEGGLPPVGVECRMTLGFGEYDRVKITYMGDGVFCYLNMRTELEYTGALRDATFRPLKSQHERQREELIKVISDCDEMAYSFRPDDIADAILSRYNVEPKP